MTKFWKLQWGEKANEQVKKFIYLGNLITDDGTSEIKLRSIEIARSHFISMKDVLASRKLKLSTRKRQTRCYVLSTLLHASEVVDNQQGNGR